MKTVQSYCAVRTDPVMIAFDGTTTHLQIGTDATVSHFEANAAEVAKAIYDTAPSITVETLALELVQRLAGSKYSTDFRRKLRRVLDAACLEHGE